MAVLENDTIWAGVDDIEALPRVLVERLRPYFATYKLIPSQASSISIGASFGRAHALAVIEAAMADYDETFGG